MDWIRTVGGQIHPIFAQLSDSVGPLDLPVGTTVQFVGVPSYQPTPSVPPSLAAPSLPIGGGALVVRPGATLDDPNRGFVMYDLSSSDVAQQGIYRCVWYVTPPGQGTPQAFPEESSMTLWVRNP